MSKFDWSRAAFRLIDPARVQRVVDFVRPDDTNKQRKKKSKPRPLTVAQKAEQEKREIKEAVARARRRMANLAKGAEALKLKGAAREKKTLQPAESSKKQAEKAERKRRENEIRLANLRANRAARAAYLKSPEYQAELAEKKEAQNHRERLERDRIRHEREPLRARWRAMFGLSGDGS